MVNILVCDDEKDIVKALDIYLNAEGYATFDAFNGEEALDILANNDIQLVLMDIMMPKMDGISAIARIRESNNNIPVILLTAKSEDTDKILGLNIGADDYVTKPFNPVELLARVKAQLRRYLNFGGNTADKALLTIGGIQLDDNAKIVTVDGEQVSLTPTEYDILYFLMENAGKVFSSSQIYEKVWRSEAFGAEGTVPVHIRHLREKLEIDPAEPRYLKVVWGKGYIFEKGVK